MLVTKQFFVHNSESAKLGRRGAYGENTTDEKTRQFGRQRGALKSGCLTFGICTSFKKNHTVNASAYKDHPSSLVAQLEVLLCPLGICYNLGRSGN